MAGVHKHVMGMSEEAVLLHGNGDLTQCASKLKLLQQQLLDVDRWKLDTSIFWNICGIIQGEVTKWNQDSMFQPSVESLTVVTTSLCCLRNTFPHCSRNQLLVAESVDLVDPIISCTQWTFRTADRDNKRVVLTEEDSHQNPLTTTENNNDCHKEVVETPEQDVLSDRNSHSEWKKAHSTLASACVTCLGNMVAANSLTRKLIWPHLLPVLRDLLGYPDWQVSQMASMILHNCLLEEGLRKELCRNNQVKVIVNKLLSLYVNESQYSCFVLFCLELLLCSKDIVEVSWSHLSGEQQLLCLDVLAAILTDTSQKRCEPLSTSTITFLVHFFKSEADKILCTHAGQLQQDGSQVLVRLANFVCTAAASDAWRYLLQQDSSLIITSLYLLRCMTDIGKMGGNAFTPLNQLSDLTDEEQMATAETHPAFGFKCDLIRLIASLVYRHKDNQDQVREMNGILLLLESSQFDARNPLIKEVSIFAVRNLLEGNLENQLFVKGLKLKSVAENPGLQELGLEAVCEGEQIRLVQRSGSSPDYDDTEL
ncbi:ataxin-10-like isoform X2 [Homarus americanus]|uniref:ataxin-10-like isoform X2 n=1 Tax=Homarus americanus TaxID=6706 RepID=UPI001C47B1A6|nr:ataxin-10-like isoform X2 [Homarus americanus]XP_042232407.1 ataxin-10-like isoform X2 [Homarus americanus]XP_042232408.1 ataxin-10-like isoform X2 [Homarus americanus]